MPLKSAIMMARQYSSCCCGWRPLKVTLATSSLLCTKSLMLPGCMVSDKPVCALPLSCCGIRQKGSLLRGTAINNTAIKGKVSIKACVPRLAASLPSKPHNTAKHMLTIKSDNKSHIPTKRLWLNKTDEPIKNNIANSKICKSRCVLPS